MIYILLALAAAAGCAAAPSATPAPDDVAVHTDYVYYPITGSTAEELRTEMDHLGPTDPDGTHHDAYTQWHVTWRYAYSTLDDRCTIGPIQVSVQVTFTLPQWEPPPDAPPELIDRWNAYLDALRRHENGHREIGMAAGQAIYQALGRLPSYAACDELERTADAAGEQILDQHRQRELDYDQATNHGATQGARFP